MSCWVLGISGILSRQFLLDLHAYVKFPMSWFSFKGIMKWKVLGGDRE
jgi:hypothetical protein